MHLSEVTFEQNMMTMTMKKGAVQGREEKGVPGMASAKDLG